MKVWDCDPDCVSEKSCATLSPKEFLKFNWCSRAKIYARICSDKRGKRIKLQNKKHSFNLPNGNLSFIKSCLRIHHIFLYFQDYVISGTGRHQCFEMRGGCRLPLILKCINPGTAYAKIFYLSDALRTLSNLYYRACIQNLLVHHQFWVWKTVCSIFFTLSTLET